jgi:branched-chain amino acid transport system permease protein
VSRRKANLLLYLGLALGTLALALWAEQSWNNYAVRLLSYAGLYVILVVSLNLVNGLTGIFSLGHAAFMSVGAYASALLTFPIARKPFLFPALPDWFHQISVPFPAALLAGGLLAMLVAFVVGFPLLRLRGHYLALGTLALLAIVQALAINLVSITRGARGLAGIPTHTTAVWVWSLAIVTIYIVARVKFSGFGLLLGAIRQDEVAASALGVRLIRYRLVSFAVSAFFAGIAGGMWAHLVGVIAPGVFAYEMTFRIIVMLIIGGLGSLTGSVIGAVGLFLLPEALTYLETVNTFGISQLLLSVLLVLVMIFRPDGLLGKRELSLGSRTRAVAVSLGAEEVSGTEDHRDSPRRHSPEGGDA